MDSPMSNELQRSMETLLSGSNSKTALAIKILSQSLDTRLTLLECEQEKRHSEIMSAIQKNKNETDQALKGIEVVRFFSAHPRWFGIIVSCILILIGAGAENLYKSIFK